MHQYDPLGTIAEYRRERDRRELRNVSVFAVLTVLAAITILAAVDITLSLYGR